MPRLLLVDDNPSIHKIAETLLAPTDIELVCVDSARAALDLVTQGQVFDVAMVDTAMPAMDGWQLLAQLRMHPATAAMPVAMMAGVLDNVDPSQFEHPSIQGFLRKPVELRDLGARVHALMETPVPPPAPQPAAPQAPAVSLEDLSAFSTVPAVKIADLNLTPAPVQPESDVLVLEETDLWPEAPVMAGTRTEDLSPFAEIPPEVQLDIEEFDFASLRNLTVGAAPAPVAEPVPAPMPAPVFEPEPEFEPEPAFEPVPEPIAELDLEPTPAPEAEPVLELEVEPEAAPSVLPSAFELFGEAPAAASAPVLKIEPTEEASPFDLFPPEPTTQELPDLGTEPEPTFDPTAFADFDAEDQEPAELAIPPVPTPAPDPDLLSDLGEVSSSSDVAVIEWSQSHAPTPNFVPEIPAFAADHAEPVLDLAPEIPEPAPTLESEAGAASLPEPVEAPAAETGPVNAEALVQAILDSPALLDRLAKALATRQSEQALREVAWEVMPELAERLNRH